MKVDILVDIAFGDSGKKKCCNSLIRKAKEDGEPYDISARANGGPNAGGTVYVGKQKIILHHIPSGVLNKTISIMGSGTVIDPRIFLEELEGLEKIGISASKYIKISSHAHIITKDHIKKDMETDSIGSTKRGISYVYADKMLRKGIRAQDCKELQEFICDQYEFLMEGKQNKKILLETAQGFGLDIDHSDYYPFVTSSNSTSSAALHSLGLPISSVNKVIACCKSFTSYVGTRDFQPKDEIFNKIQQVGMELGSTTGRQRKINWNNFNLMSKAIRINDVNILIINKMDTLREVGVWKIIRDNKVLEFETENNYKNYLINNLPNNLKIIFSDNPYTV